MSETKENLVAQLRDPSTKGRRGSIVWRLREGNYDCSDIVDDLATCILEGSFEEVQHAHDILRDTEIPAYAPEAVRTRARLQAAWDAGVHGWRREAVDNALSFLEPDE